MRENDARDHSFMTLTIAARATNPATLNTPLLVTLLPAGSEIPAYLKALDKSTGGAIGRTLRTFTGLPHRMQRVVERAGVVYVDDSKATNVGAAVKALEGVDRRVVLIAGGRDKGGSYDPLVQLLRVKARAAVLLGRRFHRLTLPGNL